jgi:acetyl-CoA synthetase
MSDGSLAAQITQHGLSEAQAERLARAVADTLPDAAAPQRWREIVDRVLERTLPFAVHRAVFRHVYQDWPTATRGPAPAWIPADDAFANSNLGHLARSRGLPDYPALHAWSSAHRAEFWEAMVQRLGIVFAQPPTGPANLADPRYPDWFPGARLNLATSCFRSPRPTTAIIYQAPGEPATRTSYGALDDLSNRVANGLLQAGFTTGSALAVAMPMGVEAVAIYLGIVKMGGCVISVSDTFSAAETGARLRLGGALAVFTQEHWTTSPLEEKLVSKLKAAQAPRLVVLPGAGRQAPSALRPGDLAWADFLSDNPHFEAVPMLPEAMSNVLFSSGTTGDPKAIPWTHTTPIRAAADAWLHHDLHPGDVVAWPTSLGWMMGPWLIYATLINGATMAIYGGNPASRGMGHFVESAGVTLLGVVPTLVRSWRLTHCIEACDWSRIRAFSSTGECSNADDMLYLMYLAGWKPVIEYCGGTEIGGGYITGTLVQPAAPATFTTPSMGLDVVILDEAGKPASNGELFILPPAIGLSRALLNHDHDEVYHRDTPPGPHGELRRRHGDQMEALPGGWYCSHGRADDTMNLKGIKVSSAELERAFAQVDDIRESAAIAVCPHGDGPSELVAYVVLRPGVEVALPKLKNALQTALRENLSSVFKIHAVRVVEGLPRTASNKVMRRSLRARYQTEQEQPP